MCIVWSDTADPCRDQQCTFFLCQQLSFLWEEEEGRSVHVFMLLAVQCDTVGMYPPLTPATAQRGLAEDLCESPDQLSCSKTSVGKFNSYKILQ